MNSHTPLEHCVRWLVLILYLPLLGACTTEDRFDAPQDASSEEPPLFQAPLARLATDLAPGHPARSSGFLLLDRGKDALAWRVFMAEQAQTTLDAQYFLWKNDRAGQVFIQALMQAADRGVRVRVLVDDSMTETDPQYLARFSAYPNVEVRLYKPFGPRHRDYVLRWVDFAADFKLLNRRMHNKLFIADDTALIVGGRNVGEDYFEYLAPNVFRCRDLLGVGPIAVKASASFDLYWNSPWAVPVEDMVTPVPDTVTAKSFAAELSETAQGVDHYPPGYASVGSITAASKFLAENLIWANARLLFDMVPGEDGAPPDPWHSGNKVGKVLSQTAADTQQEILIESAYLVLTHSTRENMAEITRRGVEIKALTNSLASNNHVSAFDGYRKQRKKQLRLFSDLYEYRPDAGSQTQLYEQLAPGKDIPLFGLHTKTTVFDRKTVFVGSLNLDPRSEHLNTEIGLLVESPELGEQVARSILGDMAPGNAWLLRLDKDGSTEWTTAVDGKVQVESKQEPLSSVGRRLEADVVEPFTPAAEM